MSDNPITGERDLGGGPQSGVASVYNYVSYSPVTGRLLFSEAGTPRIAGEGLGSANLRGIDVKVYPLAGIEGFRSGGLYVGMTRAPGQDFATGWDGNSDIAFKVLNRNYAVNAATRGSVRGVEIQAQNSGTNLGNVNAMSLNAKNDAGKTVVTMYGLQIRIEGYGTISTEACALDLNMSVEGACALATVIAVRNTNASLATAVRDVVRVSHSAVNIGFTYLFNLVGATGDCGAVGTLTQSGGGDVLCDANIAVYFNGVAYWIPLYN